MNRKYFIIGAIAIALVLAGFFAVRSYASTGCFLDTNGLPTETFICWMKDNGITSGCGGGNYCPGAYVTRSQMAVFMNKQAEIPPSTGLIVVSVAPDEWVQLYTPSSSIIRTNWDEYTAFTLSSGLGTFTFLSMPDLPAVLYGRSLNISGMEYCYTAAIGAYVNRIAAFLHTETAGASATYVTLIEDTTDRTDAACRYYSFTPQPLTGYNMLSVQAMISWDITATPIKLGRVSFYLQPTSTLFVGPTSLESTDMENGTPNVVKPEPPHTP